MNHDTANAIRSFISGNPSPTIVDFLIQDAPKYEWTRELAEVLVGRALTLTQTQATGAMELLSDEGTSVLRITTNNSGPPAVSNLNQV